MNKALMYSRILAQVEKQLNSFWLNVDMLHMEKKIDRAYERCMQVLLVSNNKYLNPEGRPKFSLYNSSCWSIFLYYLSNELKDEAEEAEKIFYLNKILHSIDWYYEIELPDHFMVEHPLGSVLGRAVYGDYLYIYQGVTIGGNVSLDKGALEYPTIGNNVVLFSNAKILGNSCVGSNVLFSANSYVINENIPDNSIVFGSSPNLVIKEDAKMVENEMRRIWRRT